MKTLTALLLALCTLPAAAQKPAVLSTIGHSLPPPVNLVNAGLLLEDAGTLRRDAKWMVLAGGVVGGVLYTQNKNVGAGVWCATLGYSVRLQFRADRKTRQSGLLLQLGYTAEYQYEVRPDSVSMDPPARLIPR